MSQCSFVCAGISSLSNIPTKNLNSILLSAANIGDRKSKKRKYKNFVDALKPEIFIMDSGGYQLLKEEEKAKKSFSTEDFAIMFDRNLPMNVNGKLNLTPDKIVNLAVEFKPDIMIGLDFPVGKYSSSSEQEIEFRKKLGFNIDWAWEINSLRKTHCPEVQYFLPIQAYTLKQFYRFWHFIHGIEMDGVSLPTRNMSIETLVQFLLTFHRMGMRKVHLLGTSRIDYFAVGAYFARHYFDWFSIDGASWRANAKYNGYMNPHDLRNEDVSREVVLNESNQMDCPCPWCQYYNFQEIQSMDYTEKSEFLLSHNFWVTNQCLKNLFENAGDLFSFYRYIHQEFRDENKAHEIFYALLKADGKRN